MEYYSHSFVKEHVEKWLTAWNNHDLKTVLSMYSDDIEFSSPKIKAIIPELHTKNYKEKGP
jgi:ketosteroid isomerase-like protein